MGIGYFQLTIRNQNDIYLIGNPEMTFFKQVYKRHTNFAKESVLLNFPTDTTIPQGDSFEKTFHITIPKNGDLVHKMYLAIDIQSNTENGVGSDASGNAYNMTNNAFGLIDDIELLIGDECIDRHTGEWLAIYSSLFTAEAKNLAICDMVDIYQNVKFKNSSGIFDKEGIVFIPLVFWFNRNPGLALPLLALQYADVRLRVKLKSNALIFNTGTGDPRRTNNTDTGISINRIQLLTEFIFLDKEEKSLFATHPHEYLIEQVQCSDKEPIESKDDLTVSEFQNYQHKIELSFNHPVKALFWSIQDDQSSDGSKVARGNQLFNYWNNLDFSDTTGRRNTVIDASIALNGYEIFDPLTGLYFNQVTKNEHFSGNGFEGLVVENTNPQYAIDLTKGIGVYSYSFALHPEHHQPSGTLNFSKLDRAELRLRVRRTQLNDTTTSVQKYFRAYALNYNILRIASGSGGLVFQN